MELASFCKWAQDIARAEINSFPPSKKRDWATDILDTFKVYIKPPPFEFGDQLSPATIGCKWYTAKLPSHTGKFITFQHSQGDAVQVLGQAVSISKLNYEIVVWSINDLIAANKEMVHWLLKIMDKRDRHGIIPWCGSSLSENQAKKTITYETLDPHDDDYSYVLKYRIVNWLSLATGEATKPKLRFIEKYRYWHS